MTSQFHFEAIKQSHFNIIHFASLQERKNLVIQMVHNLNPHHCRKCKTLSLVTTDEDHVIKVKIFW